MNKKIIIEKIQDKKVRAIENSHLLEEAINKKKIVFDVFDDKIFKKFQEPRYWDINYFNEQAYDLKNNFSKERCLHVIEVKAKLQQRGEKDFSNSLASVSKIEANSINQEKNMSTPDLSGFLPDEKLSNYLKNGSISLVRAEIETYLNNMNLNMDQLVKSIYYVYKNNPETYEEHRLYALVEDIDLNEKKWNWEYFNSQQVYLNRNFSLKRVLHLVNVRDSLAAKGVKEFQSIKKTTIYQDQRQSQETIESQPLYSTLQKVPSSNDNNFVKVALIVGGAVLAIVALLLSVSR